MNEIDRLSAELAHAFDGDPWHGSSTAAVLAGWTAAGAASHPIPGAHSAWEIVLHMTGWVREVARRLRGGTPGLPAEGDWPATPAAAGEEDWKAALRDLAAARRDLLAAVAAFPEERLDEPVGGAARDRPLGTGIAFYVMLHGLAQHDAYHSGLIDLLRKALAASP